MIKVNYTFDPNYDNGQTKYFITYFGDIYYGFCYQRLDNLNSFYIIQHGKIHEFNNLPESERIPENLNKLGWEIPDKRIISGTIDQRVEIGSDKGKIDTTKYSDHKCKRLFVFGAGASAFCQVGGGKSDLRKSSLCPPAGFEIFNKTYDSIINKYPGVIDTIPFFNLYKDDIEYCLEQEWADLIKSYNLQIVNRHINVQFFLQELFCAISKNVVENYWRNNLYGMFANKIQKYLVYNPTERFGIVSFNYDTILDSFIERIFRIKFDDMSRYIDSNSHPVILLKPHGSCNWGWPISSERLLDYRNEVISDYLYKNMFDFSTIYFRLLGDFNEMVHKKSWSWEQMLNENGLGRFTINKNQIQIIKEGDSGKFYPSLLLPYRDKDEFLMHYDHQHALHSIAGEVEELYLFGWKGNENKFNRLLELRAHNLKKIIIVNPDDTSVVENLKKYNLLKSTPLVIKTFEEFVFQLDSLLK